MILVDTNVVSELMKLEPDNAVRKWYDSVANDKLFITTISIFEIEYGLHRLPNGKRKNSFFERFEHIVGELEIAHFEETAASFAARFYVSMVQRGLNTGSEDMMIAGICAQYDATLASRNLRDFESLPIEVVNPWEVI